jgi:hypothetical protein
MEPFSIVDVGASGGIDSLWRVFGDDLRGFGFDGLIHEVQRLNATEPNGSQIRYFPCLVGSRSFRAPEVNGLPDNQPYWRSSCVRAASVMNLDYQQAYNDPSGDCSTTKEKIGLDEFFLKTHPHNVDFIKIGTDGHDYEVLMSARN